MDKKSKIITICGSMKFEKQILSTAMKLELDGNCVLMPVFSSDKNKDDFTLKEVETLGKMHRVKIDLSDAIFVVNVNGYIGSSTKSEIEYAKANNKEIMFLEKINI